MKNNVVYGVGVNDADYKVSEHFYWKDGDKWRGKRTWVCPFYAKWTAILARCYSVKRRKGAPSYEGVYVCEGWHLFSNFKAWMEAQDWQGKQLDKDLLVQGNKVYSEQTCCFINARLNSFLTEANHKRGLHLIGACWIPSRGKFVAFCADGNGKQVYLGHYDTELEAHKAWLDFKLSVARELAKLETDPKIAFALISRYENYKIT